MKSVVLGTAGHVDHGKTALIEALTGINTDRWEEERRRGITIDLGFAAFPSGAEDLEISVVDVPGHEDFVKNMLAGATGIDLLLLVVAADEGPMPQTREHLWIASFLGVEEGVAAVTKSDLVDADWRALVTESVREELARAFGRADWPVVSVSSVTGEGLDELKGVISDSAKRVRARRQDDLFRLPVDRSFSVRGVGTVVTGTVWGGRLVAGSEVRILPAERRARVRGIQIHGRDAGEARAGQRAALALVGVDRSEVGRGDLLTTEPVWRSSFYLDVRLSLIPDSPWPLKDRQRVRFHLGTSETLARIALLEGDRMQPGETALLQLRLEEPVVARAGDRFVVRFYSPVMTIGGGVILDPWATRWGRRGRRRRGTDGRPLDRLDLALEERLHAVLCGPRAGAAESELAVLVGLAPSDLREHLKSLAARGRLRELEGRWFASEAFAAVRKTLLAAMAAEHARDRGARGVSLEALRSGIGEPIGVVNAVLAELQREGAVRIEGSVAALAEHVPRLDPERQAMADEARARISASRFTPPAVAGLARELGVGEDELLRVLKFLVERGDLVAVTADLYFDSGVISEVKERVGRFLAQGRVATPSELGKVLEVSRKYLIPLLEHLDARGFTRRTSGGRVLREPG